MASHARLLEKELGPHHGERLISRDSAVEVTHLDERALQIVAETTMSTYNRQGHHRGIRASNILNDFFHADDFRGKRIIELGPGHYTFALLARNLGAEVVCVERHPLHAELGRYLGFQVLEVDFEGLTPEAAGGPFDGLWMKAATNACNAKQDSEVEQLPQSLTALVGVQGWGWIAPRNVASGLEGEAKGKFEEHRIELQRSIFESCGWRAQPIEEGDRKRYALSFAGARYVYLRNLSIN